MYIDTRLFDKERKKSDYLKTIALVDFIVVIILFFLVWVSPNGNIKQTISNVPAKIIDTNTNIKKLAEIGEEMFTGPPQF